MYGRIKSGSIMPQTHNLERIKVTDAQLREGRFYDDDQWIYTITHMLIDMDNPKINDKFRFLMNNSH